MKLFTKEIDQKLFDQYIMGSDMENQMVVAKIFNPYGNGVWYLLNSDPSDPDYLWAIVDLFDVEVGSVSREELETLKVPPFRLGLERDLYFTPVNAKKLYESLLSGEKFEDGGTIDIVKDKSGDNWVFPNNPKGDTYGIKLAAGGMTAGRFYKDNTGKELRYIGESQGKLLFKDGEKVVYKDESDFEDAPEEKRIFGFFEDGGELKDEFLEDMAELHQDIAHITLVDGSRVSGEELRNAHQKIEDDGIINLESVGTYLRTSDMTTSPNADFKNDGEVNWVYENSDEWWKALSEKDKNTIGKYNRIHFRKTMMKENPKLASGGFTSSFSGTPDRRRVTKEKGGELAQWYVVSAKENKVVSGGFDNEDEAKKFMYDLFEKNKDFSLAIKKIAKSSGVEFTPYGETKGIYKIYYKADGKPQTEIWETKEMAVNAAKRYSSPKMQGEYTNIKVFDEDGAEVDYMSEPKYVRGGMLMHGFNEGDKVIEIYKGQGIVESNGIIVVVNPDHGTRFIIDLDESKPFGQKSMNMSMEQQLKSAKEYIDWVSKDKETPDTLVSVIKDYGTYGRYAKGGMLTDAKKEAILKKKGNIIIFKEVLEPTDEGRKSITVQRFVKSRKNGAVKLEGSAYDTQWFESMQDLINAVDWSKWESNKYAKGGQLFIPHVGNIDDFLLKSMLQKNSTVKKILGTKEMDFLNDSNTDVIGVSGKNYDFIVTDGEKEFEFSIHKNGRLIKPLRAARPQIVEHYKNRYNSNMADGGKIFNGRLSKNQREAVSNLSKEIGADKAKGGDLRIPKVRAELYAILKKLASVEKNVSDTSVGAAPNSMSFRSSQSGTAISIETNNIHRSSSYGVDKQFILQVKVGGALDFDRREVIIEVLNKLLSKYKYLSSSYISDTYGTNWSSVMIVSPNPLKELDDFRNIRSMGKGGYMADGGETNDELNEKIESTNQMSIRLINKLAAQGYDIENDYEASYYENAHIILSDKVSVSISLDSEISLVIKQEDGSVKIIDCGKNTFSKLFEELKNIDLEKMARGGRTKFKDKVQSIKASLLKRKKVSPKVQKDYGKTYSPKEAEESATRIAGSIVQKEKRKPRVSKILEKMKKGTQIKKKKSTFKDRMKQLSTKIKERKSKSTK